MRVDAEDPAPELVREAVGLLRAGELVIFPTDTLYALGGTATREAARRVRAAKTRDAEQPLPLVAASREQALALASSWPEAARRLAERFWPGPLTLVLNATPGLPEEVTARSGTVAVRVPALPLARSLCRGAGPLISTSANASGERPPLTCREAVAAVGGAAALALDAGAGRAEPSTIVDVSGPAPRLLRAGAVPWEAVLAALRRGARPLES